MIKVGMHVRLVGKIPAGYERYRKKVWTVKRVGPMRSQYLLTDDNGEEFWTYAHTVTMAQLT